MKMVMTGDSFISRRLPCGDGRAEKVKGWMADSNARFTNLEITAHEGKGYPSPFSGGTWAMAEPAVLDDLRYYGFNLFNWANNHTMDYLYGGLIATEKELDDRDMIHAGAGKTLASAAEASYIETENGRIALIGVTSTFHDFWIAGNGNGHIGGRPGVNPLRCEEIIHVTKEELEALRSISSQTNLDAAEELNRIEGFSNSGSEDEFLFAGRKFKIADEAYKERKPHQGDMDRLINKVEEAKRQADYVLVSFHSHEMTGLDKNTPADFFKEASRRMIDAGAHCIIGHGPHVIRGIEIYRGRPIFYSLGNFIFQNDSVRHLPRDFYEKYDLDEKASAADGYDKRSAGGTKGLGVNPFVWESVMAKVEWTGGYPAKIELQPIDLGFNKPRYRKGWPELSEDERVLQRLQKLSEPFDTDIRIEDGKGFIYL
ncbi:CapA family protein [Salimicrobium halophilum]|uniref:Poly-gamma-glutamate synthesis protein (Capsule biosynthesis protein) n=1 Tax=Salimicrobium halophilum TaxID=86666 RepID=A0A1G8UI98_9BACI|nr:CapA family protein [Salimicrobium halophilum]SDJ52865.1 poly-gamma-glutamate synthesis protein (capsule biosynthesis protein) [Salimicrobium halophilum]